MKVPSKKNLLSVLSELFHEMEYNEIRTGTIECYSFLDRLRLLNPDFQGPHQQDAHELYSYVINNLAETIQMIQKREDGDRLKTLLFRASDEKTLGKTFVHDTFEGIIRNETKCLSCGTVSSRKESFFEISIDIEDRNSVASCLRRFSEIERLGQDEGFHCEKDSCSSARQPAEKKMILEKLPKVLVLHLKRFRYDQARNGFLKLHHRVSFALELKLWCSEEPDVLFKLKGVVVHCGPSAGSGHYINCVEVEGVWFMFNDDHVKVISSSQLAHFFGGKSAVGAGYLLFYERVEQDS